MEESGQSVQMSSTQEVLGSNVQLNNYSSPCSLTDRKVVKRVHPVSSHHIFFSLYLYEKMDAIRTYCGDYFYNICKSRDEPQTSCSGIGQLFLNTGGNRAQKDLVVIYIDDKVYLALNFLNLSLLLLTTFLK